MSLNKETDKENLSSVSINEKNNMIKKIVQDLPKQKKNKIKNNLLFFQNFKNSKFFLNDNTQLKERLKKEKVLLTKQNSNNCENDISISTNTNTTVLIDLKENSDSIFSFNKKIFVKKHIDKLKTFFSPQKPTITKKILLNKLEIKENNQVIKPEVNLEDLLLLEEKFNDIKLTIINYSKNNNNIISLKCLEWWNYFLNSTINGNLEQYFIDNKFKQLVYYFSIIQFACVIIIYDSSFNNKIIERNKNKILTLINLLQVNYLIIFDYIISKISISCKNNLWVKKCVSMLKKKLIINIASHFTQIKLNNSNSYNILNDILLIIHVTPSKEENKIEYIYEKFYDRSNEQLNLISKEEIINLFKDKIYRYNELNPNEFIIQNKNKDIVFHKNLVNKYQNAFYIKQKAYYSITQNSTSLNQSLETNSQIIKKNVTYNRMNTINNSSKISLQTYNNLLNLHNNNNKNDISFSNDILLKSPNYPILKFPPKKELTLVLDLDETIISFHYKDNNKKEGILNFRPGLKLFLEEISKLYEIIIFTCATKEYASPILDKIEKDKKYFSERLYREHNVLINNEYIKDISLLGRNIEKIIIVDNLIQNFRLQKENGILISWYCGDNDNDNTLFNLQKLLIRIYDEREDDVRNLLKKYKNEIVRKISSNMDFLDNTYQLTI
jgi:Dullard-like phosphatase family protein